MTEDQENLPLLHPVAEHRRVFAAQNAGRERWVTCCGACFCCPFRLHRRADRRHLGHAQPRLRRDEARGPDAAVRRPARPKGDGARRARRLVPALEARRRVRRRARERHARRLLLRHELPAVDALRLRRRLRPRLVRRAGSAFSRASSPTCRSASCAATTRSRASTLEAQLVLRHCRRYFRLFERRDGGGGGDDPYKHAANAVLDSDLTWVALGARHACARRCARAAATSPPASAR